MDLYSEHREGFSLLLTLFEKGGEFSFVPATS